MTGFRPPIWNGAPVPYDAPITDLRAAVGQPGPKAWVAIRALAEKPDAAALAVLVELSRSSDAHLRRAAIEGIGIHRSGASHFDVVCQALHDREAIVVRAATEAAASHRLQPAHDRILALVAAPEESTRLAAFRSLEVLWHSSDFEAVFDRYLHDSSDRVRKQAAWTLHKNVDAEHWERVFSVWSKDALPRHRAWACELAGSFGNRTVAPLLEELRADRDGHVRSAAEQALAQVGAG
jgi:HEAT repeat protein